jgi:hypothetical protein
MIKIRCHKGRERLGLVVAGTDLESAEELTVLRRKTKLAVAAGLSTQLLAVHQVRFTSLVEADRHFEHQEEIVAGGTDARQYLGDLLRI